ncbi:MAG: MBL fold metallo-hydrolase [Nannocystaceae bacterium]
MRGLLLVLATLLVGCAEPPTAGVDPAAPQERAQADPRAPAQHAPQDSPEDPPAPQARAGARAQADPRALAEHDPNDSSEDPPADAAPGDAAPRLVILGSAQDGGLPHASCTCPHCQAAIRDPGRARAVASVALLEGDLAHLVDATPDITAQLRRLAALRPARPPGVDRSPLAGVLLTHAHIGHYLGLALLGFEAVHTQQLPVHASPRMLDLLAHNAPWEQLVRLENITPRPLPGGASLRAGAVTIHAITVPHRDEYTDTLAFRFEGPTARVLYLPDTDPWRRWEADPLPLFDDVDVALVDGSFYSLDELPGRDLEQIAHPLMTETMDLLAPRVAEGRLRALFIHINHSNPALDPDSAAARSVRARGFELARDGMTIPL